jgi:restriction system protein
VRELIERLYPNWSKAKVSNSLGQWWTFARKMKPGDLCVTPSKFKPVLYVGSITGDCQFDAAADEPYFHYRDVKWIETGLVRSRLDQDLRHSLNAMSTIAAIRCDNAEKRIRDLIAGQPPTPPPNGNDGEPPLDLERLGLDGIVSFIERHFKGHGLARLVEAVLQAQGYTTYRSPPGPDKGIDLLAAPGPLGFGRPRICVQVKSTAAPVDRPTLDQLIGTMQNVHAEQGLLVSWGGFKSSIDREEAAQFFRVRLWDQDKLVEQILGHYESLDADLRAELPLKRVWTLAAQDEDSDGTATGPTIE